MAPAIRPPLQAGTSTRVVVSPDQRLSVQDFLRSLKKPTRPLPTSKRFGAPPNDTFKPVNPPWKPAEAPKLETIASTVLEDPPFIDSAASGLWDLPESTPDEICSEQVLSPSPEAKRLRPPNPKGADEKDQSMKIPKVTRTYTKKAKHVSPQQNVSPALLLTQFPTPERALLDGLPNDGSGSTTEQLAFRKPLKNKLSKKHNSAVSQKRKQQPLQDDEEIHREDHGEYVADILITEKNKKTKRKKRRVPVNELALVKRLPSREDPNQKVYDSDNAIDLLIEHLDGQGFPEFTSSSLERSRKSTRAIVGKPVTRIRQDIAIPQQEILAREGFRFPPITPRATKSPGWRLGSGFEGVILELSMNKRPETTRKRKVKHARTPCFLRRPLPKLDLSTRLSPLRQSVGQKGISRRQKDPGGSVEIRKYEPTREVSMADDAVEDGVPHRAAKTGGKSAFEQVASLSTPPHASTENDQSPTASSSYCNVNIKGPIQLHQTQNRDLDASQAVREPSKSERTGWLKRRKASFAVAGGDAEEQLFVHTQRASITAGEHERRNGRNGFDTYLEDTAQAQHAVYTDLQASNEGGQTTPHPKRSVNSQQQDVLEDEQSAEQHSRRVPHDAQEQSSESEEEAFNYQSLDWPPEPPPSSDSEADFPSSPFDARELLMSKPRHQIQVPRTSEVPEIQGRPRESIELDHKKTEILDPGLYSYRIPATTLDSGKYFSKAVQLLESPEKVPHTVMRRRSRREPNQDVRGSQVMFGTQIGACHVNVAPIIRNRKEV